MLHLVAEEGRLVGILAREVLGEVLIVRHSRAWVVRLGERCRWSLCDGPVNTVLNFLCRSVMLSWFGLGYFGLSVEQLLLSFSRLCVKKYFWFESGEMGK